MSKFLVEIEKHYNKLKVIILCYHMRFRDDNCWKQPTCSNHRQTLLSAVTWLNYGEVKVLRQMFVGIGAIGEESVVIMLYNTVVVYMGQQRR